MAGIIAEVLRDALPRSGQSFERWNVSVNAPAQGSPKMGDVWLDDLNADSDSIGSSKVAKRQVPCE